MTVDRVLGTGLTLLVALLKARVVGTGEGWEIVITVYNRWWRR